MPPHTGSVSVPSAQADEAAHSPTDQPAGKAEFGHIYNRVDAAAYYETLAGYDYRIPHYGALVAQALLQARGGEGDEPPTVVDLCCSYGVGGALLTTDLELDDIYAHYRKARENGISGEDLASADREFLTQHRLPDAPRVVGLDTAGNAVRFAVSSGALDVGVVADFEHAPSASAFSDALGDASLILSTGGVGYIGERTFEAVLDVIDGEPWVAVFCLRTYDYEPIAAVLENHGLHTERASSTFPQRRFVSEDEQEWAVQKVLAHGLDPAGKESEGMFHADLYVSRPAADVRRLPLADLLP